MIKFEGIILFFLKSIVKLTTKSNFSILNLFEKEVQNCDTILDLGCGKSSIIQKMKLKPEYTLGVDIYPQYIQLSKNKNIHNDYLLINILDIDKKVKPKSFDCVILIDVIEHLSKIDGLKIIRKMQKIARKKIIIFTPNRYIAQEPYDGNIYQLHKSKWDVKIFKKMVFHIYGINGLKWLRGDLAKLKFNPIEFWKLISTLTNPIVKKFPQLAFQLFCVKEL